jgi:hypothetical protein
MKLNNFDFVGPKKYALITQKLIFEIGKHQSNASSY